jgi:hypothetical protein
LFGKFPLKGLPARAHSAGKVGHEATQHCGDEARDPRLDFSTSVVAKVQTYPFEPFSSINNKRLGINRGSRQRDCPQEIDPVLKKNGPSAHKCADADTRMKSNYVRKKMVDS